MVALCLHALPTHWSPRSVLGELFYLYIYHVIELGHAETGEDTLGSACEQKSADPVP